MNQALHRIALAGFVLFCAAQRSRSDDKKAAASPQAQAKKAATAENPKSLPPLLSPEESLAAFSVPDDLDIELVLAEPAIRQPLFINWDERGRMWVVQYIQYPYPEGLKMVSRDEYWRAVYDKVPLPPPDNERGLDRISIHEDTDGDGVYDHHKTFLEGLNIATACERGRGGVWVLNPPYLLFYADRDNDDVPDGDPEVHLQGFGIEDTHSVVNSLRWGPDGWLYAAQGSTVSGNVIRPGVDKPDKHAVHSMGQLIWRYHPESRRYEIFAEGGGNAFGVEIDEQGRIFSGHNGGNTRGFHYVQGGYFQKGFTKHGPLSNPFAFGFFPAMKNAALPRFTHNFVIYGGAALPKKYKGKLFGIEPLQGRIALADVQLDGSSFKTVDLGHPATTTDKRMRPVEIKSGPDGAVYFADWCEPQISHREHFKGNIDKDNGRIFRLVAKDAKPHQPVDLSSMTSNELLAVLDHPNKWYRQTAQRLFGDRKDASVAPRLKDRIENGTGQAALESLWALNLSGGFDEEFALRALDHVDPFVRLWTVRLLCDEKQVTPNVARKLADLAGGEQSVYVRSQLASSARRLPATDALPIIRNLLGHSQDTDDLHMPLLLWWALESKSGNDRDAVIALFEDRSFWELPMVAQHIAERVMRRYAQGGTRKDLVTAARLLELSPGKSHNKSLMRGFELAYKGRSLSGLPQELAVALAKAGGGSLSLSVRQGKQQAIDKSLDIAGDEKADAAQRLELIQVFGEVDLPSCVPVLLSVLASTNDEMKTAALTSLQRYRGAEVGRLVVEALPEFSEDVRDVAHTLLVSRVEWNRALLDAVDSGRIEAASVPLDVVRKMTIHNDERIQTLVHAHWKNVEGASTAQMQALIQQYAAALGTGSGDPYAGKKHYEKTCAKCHLLFGQGGRIGPDLTTYKRDDVLRILINVVNPSAEVREGFETFVVLTEDGRTVSGFKYDEDNQVVVIRGVDGQNITIAQDEIEEMLPQRKSLMPEDLLKGLSDQDVRDLFAFLRISQPLNK